MRTITIEAQKGPQLKFQKCSADIAIYGGEAGSGKTWGLMLDPLKYYSHPEYQPIIFRRTLADVKKPGGLWDEGVKLYGLLGATPKIGSYRFRFPNGYRVQFGHLEHEDTIYDWKGGQIPWIGFDELTSFTEKQFFYMLSRNRSTTGLPARIRATTNADFDSWVRKLIDWWIDKEGFAIPERSGKKRYFHRSDSDELIWSDDKETLVKKFKLNPVSEAPRSVTFIPATLDDNPSLTKRDPTYRARLMALPRVDRERLLHGNWNIKASAGNMFNRTWFGVTEAVPTDGQLVRYWDLAGTEKNDSNDPAFTAGVKLKLCPDGRVYVLNVVRGQWNPLEVERTILNTARQDGTQTTVCIEQDPGQAGKMEANYFTRVLQGFVVKAVPAIKDKVTRAGPVSAQCEAGNVWLVKGSWNDAFFDELERFPEGKKKDQVDAFSGAYNYLTSANVGSFTKEQAESRIRTRTSSHRGETQW